LVCSKRSFFGAFLLLSAHGCKTRPAHQELVADTIDASSSTRARGDAGAETRTAPAPTSPFTVVVGNNGGDFKLVRLAVGPVLGFESLLAAYQLSADGTLAPVEPLVTLGAEKFGRDWTVGRVTGVWPSKIFVEVANAAGRAGTLQKNIVFDAERAVASVTPMTGKHIAAAWPWFEGTLLGFEAEGPVGHLEDVSFARKGRFVLLDDPHPQPPPPSKARPAPELPKGASVDGRFVAYPSGRIFVIGGTRRDTNDVALDMSRLWDFQDGVHATSVTLPAEMKVLVHGREEAETLAAGPGGLARFDGHQWVKVEAPFADAEVESISAGDDGSVWLVADNKVWRSDFPALRFVHVALPSGLTPMRLSAHDAADVWLVAKADETTRILLHTQARVAPQKVLDSFALPKEVLLKKDPAPFSADCRAPFFILGGEGEVEPREVVALSKKLSKAFSSGGTPVLGRIKSGKVYGVYGAIDSFRAEQQVAATLAVFGAEKARRPNLRLVCTIPVVEDILSP
jgi:hypothetical protein